MKKFTRLMLTTLIAVMLFVPLSVVEAEAVTLQGFNGDILTTGPIPESHETAELMWTKRFGEPQDWASTTTDLTSDGEYLYCVVGSNLAKIQPLTGETITLAPLAGAAAFTTLPPYIDRDAGMIFVGLNNGVIQALDYETLESLWVYRDPQGGQMIMPIVTTDSHVYAGFWTSETEKANFVALNLHDNPAAFSEPVWSFSHVGGFYWTRPLLIDDVLIVGSDDGAPEYGAGDGFSQLLMLNQVSGALVDSIDTVIGDLRSGIVRTEDTIHFASKPGYYYTVKLARDGEGMITGFNSETLNQVKLPGTTVSTPTISPLNSNITYLTYGNREGFFREFGHGFVAIDNTTMTVKKTIETRRYPQGTPLMKFEQDRVSLYGMENFLRGGLVAVTDVPDADQFTDVKTLVTPFGSDSQYGLSSPVTDQYGNLFFRNDSGTIFALSARLQKLEVTHLPDKTVYTPGETFDPTGLVVKGTFSNGITREMKIGEFTVPDFELTTDDTVVVLKTHRSYHDEIETIDGEERQTGGHFSDPFTVEIPIEVKEKSKLSGWHVIDGHTKYFVDGEYVTGLQTIGKTRYLFNGSGELQRGWHVVNGKQMYFNTKNGGLWTGKRKIGNTTYLLASDGGKLFGWHRLNGKDYYFDPNFGGGMITGKRQVGKTIYFFNQYGYKDYGWKMLSGKKYYFDEQYGGGMITGLRTVGNGQYFFRIKESAAGANDQGSALMNDSIVLNGNTYYFNANGLLVKVQ